MLRWPLLLIALCLAMGGLFTAFMAPSWMNYHYRVSISAIEGERGYQFVILPLSVGLVAWLTRHRHKIVNAITLGLCLGACGLMLKPIVQAWQLGRTLPRQLATAFGATASQQEAFSFASLFASSPEPVPVEEMNYRGSLMLDFYRAIGRSAAPCVISLHGGGFTTGGHRARRPLNYWLARHGYAVATPDYRGFPLAIWPAQRRDVLDAITFLRLHAATLGIDPTRIVLMGFSAGGMLAEATAFAAHDSGIRGVIGFYGPTDLRAAWYANSKDILNGWTERGYLETTLGGTPETATAAYDSLSSLVLASPLGPPTLLFHGHLDSLVPENQSEDLSKKLTASAVPHLFVSVPWATHGFNLVNFEGPGGQITTYGVSQFLAAVTR